MDILHYLGQGFSAILTPANLWWVLAGALMGTLVGALPGLGPTAGMSVLLPVVFGMNPTSSLIMLGGIYYGAMYGGTITSVLLNVPGESDSIFTALEGHQLAQRGRAGAVLTIAALASFVAGTIGVILLSLLAPLLADWTLNFGPPAKFGVVLLGLVLVSSLVGGVPSKGYVMLAFGLALGTVGLDIVSGIPRFTFGNAHLLDGIDFLPVTVGVFGMSTVMENIERRGQVPIPAYPRLRELLPNRNELRQSWGPALRGTGLGFLIGTIPGSGTTIGATLSYAVEGRRAKRPEKFGRGAIEGVAGPEAANNAVTSGAMVPILALGIPSSPASAVLLAAILIHGLRPGPGMFADHPTVVWGFIASMYLGNIALLILNTFFIPLFTLAVVKSARFLNPLIAVLCVVGVFAYRNSLFDVVVMLAFAVIGYLLKKLNYPAVPVVLGVLLGPIAELHFRQSLVISGGDPSIFFTHTISAVFIAMAVAAGVFSALRARRRTTAERTPDGKRRTASGLVAARQGGDVEKDRDRELAGQRVTTTRLAGMPWGRAEL